MLAAGGAGAWEEVLAATSGQQKQIKMRYLLGLGFLVFFLFFYWIGNSRPALHASQNRLDFPYRCRKVQRALLSVTYHITSF